MSRENHPVWEVYDLHRTARLRIKYYCAQLARAQMANSVLEIFLAVTVSTSAIGTLAFWSTPTGKEWWQVLAVVAAVAAVAKPFLALPKRIQEADEAVTGYRLIEQRLMRLESRIRNTGQYDADVQSRFAGVMDDLEAIVLKHPKSTDNKGWINKYSEEVNQELPNSSFFVPER